MTTTTAPAAAVTSTGATLPIVALPQTELLTVNENDLPLFENALGPGVSFRILRLDLERNEWVAMATFAPGAEIPMHYHTGPAEVLTLKGRWIYKEYPNQPQTAGSYLYEPGGSVHTLIAPADNTEDTVFFVRVAGTNINFDDEGNFHSLLDAMSLRFLTDSLATDRGIDGPTYITGGEAGLTGQA